MSGSDIDRMLEKLVQDVEAAVRTLRSEVRDLAARQRPEPPPDPPRPTRDVPRPPPTFRPTTPIARPTTPGGAPAMPGPLVGAPVPAGGAAGWTPEEGEAVMKCITAWLPMGTPSTADPTSKCVAGMKELVPTWEQRERAREAVRRISQP